jgi:superfamily I DNA and RNA helicase
MPDEHKWGDVIYSDLSSSQSDFLTMITTNSQRNYFLQGCAGSGKTIIASFATGIMTEKQDKKVKLLVFTKVLAKFIRDGFPDSSSANYNVDYFHDWKKNDVEFHDVLIVDESQDFESYMVSAVRSKSKNQIWMGDASQQLYEDAKKDGAFEKIYKEIDSQRRVNFDTNYRNSISIAQLAKAFITINDLDRDANLSKEQKVKDFIEPIARNRRQTSGAKNQPNLFIEARNESEELDAIAQLIKNIQSNKETDKQIAVAQLKNSQLKELDYQLTNRGVSLTKLPSPKERTLENLPNFKNKGLTFLSTIHSLKGLEFDYVIFPKSEIEKIDFWAADDINMNLFFVLFSRAKTRIICSYVNKENSFIYNAIRNDINNSFFQFIKASEVVEDQFEDPIEEPIPENKEVVEVQNKKAEELVKEYFDGL